MSHNMTCMSDYPCPERFHLRQRFHMGVFFHKAQAVFQNRDVEAVFQKISHRFLYTVFRRHTADHHVRRNIILERPILIVSGIETFMEKEGVSDIAELIGCVK